MDHDPEEVIDRMMAQRLSPARRGHVRRVADIAEELARRYGADPVKARLAGLLHDYARELPEESIRELAARFQVLGRAVVPSVELLHGEVASRLLPEEVGIDDPEILSAVARHTTGDAGMSLLDKVVYLADAIEPARSFPGVERLRSRAREDLTCAVKASLEGTLRHLSQAGLPVDPRTVAAWESLAGRPWKS